MSGFVNVKDRGQAARVVIMPVGKHDAVGPGKVDAKRLRIMHNSVALAGVEENAAIVGLYPKRQAVFRKKSGFSGNIVDKNGN